MDIDYDLILEKWSHRVDLKKEAINNTFDRGLLKAAIYCNQQALKNAMAMIYNTSVPVSNNGEPLWKRTGLYKAAMGYGMDYQPHTAVIYNTAPYAKAIEYGDSNGRQGRPIMSNSVFNNKPQIEIILKTYLKEVVN